MLKLIVGVKGTGKTKELISLVNKATEETNGAVVCIEKGTKLMHEISYKTRLIDTEAYDVTSAASLYGLAAGTYASNHDVTHIFVDSALKICNNDLATFGEFVKCTAAFAEKNGIEVVMTSSIPAEELPEEIKKYL